MPRLFQNILLSFIGVMIMALAPDKFFYLNILSPFYAIRNRRVEMYEKYLGIYFYTQLRFKDNIFCICEQYINI